MKRNPLPPSPLVLWGAITLLLLTAGCQPKDAQPAPVRLQKIPVVEDPDWFTPREIAAAAEGKPWISHVNVVDLEQNGKPGILACDDKLNAIIWLRQAGGGKFTESVLMADLPGVVHVEAVDMDGDGDLDLLASCMGEVFPNNDKIGAVVILENDGRQHFTKHVIADHIARVTDIRAADLDGDGKLDLAVAQFGYDQGEIRWMKNLGHWQFESHILLNLSGTINICIADLNGDRTPDLVALVSQQWEEIHLFENDGHGNFKGKVLFGSTNEDFGSSGISLCDLNRDGRPDVLYTNGDGFAYADPGKRPWHGVQWLENLGQGFFRYHRIGDFPGAYSPVGVDLNGDGAMDIVAVSGFNEWSDPTAASLVAFMNDGAQNFKMHVLAHAPTHQLTCAAGDLDGSGRVSLVTAGFYSYPPFDRMGRITLWQQTKKP